MEWFMNFGEWLSYIESVLVGSSIVEIRGPYIDPDEIWRDSPSNGKRPFIYLGKDVVSGGKLAITDYSYYTHIVLIKRNADLQKRMNGLGYGDSVQYRIEGTAHDLMGRMGEWEIKRDGINWEIKRDGNWERVTEEGINFLLVSFWNDEKSVYDHNLLDCLRSMESYFEGKEVFVSTPLLGTVHISKVMGGAVGVAMSDEEKEKMDLRMRLHIMGPIEKKAAMAKLGLGGVKVSKRWDWEAGMRGLGMPGYMRQSEWSGL
jgi:hypothetical protein